MAREPSRNSRLKGTLGLLNPSLKVDPAFATVILDLVDGERFSGFLQERTTDGLSMHDIAAMLQTLQNKDIRPLTHARANSLFGRKITQCVPYGT